VADPIDDPRSESAVERSAPSPIAESGELADLARWTGGALYIVSTPANASVAARNLLAEMRHQYLLAFEASAKPGWYRLEVRTKDKDHRVRARAGYFAGQNKLIGGRGASADPGLVRLEFNQSSTLRQEEVES
jgi:hypothetical protein